MPKGRKKGITYTKKNVNKKDKILARFQKKYIIDEKTGCWMWQGNPNQGYGTFYMKGKMYPAHRASYIIFISEISDALMVCHKCNTGMCVNPHHLYAGTHTDNMQDLRDSKALAGENNPNYGVVTSEEKKRKISIGVKKWIENNPKFDPSIYTSKNWIIENPDGKILKIKNLSEFCRKNNLSLSSNNLGFYIKNCGWSLERRLNESS